MISSPGWVCLTNGASGPMSTRAWTTSRPGMLRSCCWRSVRLMPGGCCCAMTIPPCDLGDETLPCSAQWVAIRPRATESPRWPAARVGRRDQPLPARGEGRPELLGACSPPQGAAAGEDHGLHVVCDRLHRAGDPCTAALARLNPAGEVRRP